MISIILTTYNDSHFLRKAIPSCFPYDYRPNPKGTPYRLPTKIDYTNQPLARAWFRILGEYVSEGYSSSKAVVIVGASKEAMEKTAGKALISLTQWVSW